MDNVDAQITLYGMNQLKTVNAQINSKFSTKPQIRAIVSLLTLNSSVDSVDLSAHKMNGGQPANVNVKILL